MYFVKNNEKYTLRPDSNASSQTQFKRYSRNKFRNNLQVTSIEELEVFNEFCEVPNIDLQCFHDNLETIVQYLKIIFDRNEEHLSSYKCFQKLLQYKPFVKSVIRDLFSDQDIEKITLHKIFNFVREKHYKLTKSNYKFFQKYIFDTFLQNNYLISLDEFKQTSVDKIFENNSELSLFNILVKMHQNRPNTHYLQINNINDNKEKEVPQNSEPFMYAKLTDEDLKQQTIKKKQKLDSEIAGRLLNDSLLKEVNVQEEETVQEVNSEIGKDEEEDEEERKISSKSKNLKNQEMQNLLNFDNEEEEEKKGNLEKNINKKFEIKDDISLNEEEFREQLEKNDKPAEITMQFDEKIIDNFDMLENIQDDKEIRSIASKVMISHTYHFLDFIIPKNKLISKSIKSIEILYGKIVLECDNCTFAASEIIIKKSNYPKLKEGAKICSICSQVKSGDKNLKNSKNNEVDVSQKIIDSSEAKELKAYFKITIIPKKKCNENTSFCQVMSQNSLFWSSVQHSKTLKKKVPPKKEEKIDPRKRRPKPKEFINETDSKDFRKLFENITFLITCECEEKSYEHKGLPYRNDNSFQYQCDKCWSSMLFQIDEIEAKVLDLNEFNSETKLFRKEEFFS